MQDLKELNEVITAIKEEIRQGADALTTSRSVYEFKKTFLDNKQGRIGLLMKEMRNVPNDQKAEFGKTINGAKEWANQFFDELDQKLKEKEQQQRYESEKIDISMPPVKIRYGNLHPVTTVRNQLTDIFASMGFEVYEGTEIETDYYNFTALNTPQDHPARDMQDTFYITEEILLRTHTSPVQARAMDAHDFSKGPLKMISPGRVFRRDTDDATHSHQFHQIEGLVVGKNISMADLQGTLQLIVQKMFGAERQIRLRPSYFPFTEPSVEVDVSCFKCGGAGCNVCKKTGWIEIMGAGMVHPRVLEMSGIDPTVYSGFAFGLGQERVAMLRYGINDIRGFYQGDVRFSEQFK